jgi:class 3 adenylate cyclase/streptogramin lyase
VFLAVDPDHEGPESLAAYLIGFSSTLNAIHHSKSPLRVMPEAPRRLESDLDCCGSGGHNPRMPTKEGVRRLATVLFTDIVRSSEIASRLGDARWRALLAKHHALIRQVLKRHGGVEIDTAGDGFFITFPTPAEGIRAACEAVDAVRAIGLDLRAGVHVGEVEKMGAKVAGVGVVIASRISTLAEPGEVLASSTVQELVAGSGIEFADRGEHSLKGVSGVRRLCRVTSIDGRQRPVPLGEAGARWDEAELEPVHARRRRRVVFLAAVAVLIAGSTLVLLSRRAPAPHATDRTSSTATVTDVGRGVVALDVTTGKIVAQAAVALVGYEPPAVAGGARGIWVRDAQNLVHLDARTGQELGTTSLAGFVGGVAVGSRLAWVGGTKVVHRIDPSTDTQLRPVSLRSLDLSGLTIVHVAAGGGHVWVLDQSGVLGRIDPVSGKVDGVLSVADDGTELAVGNGTVWVLDAFSEAVVPVDVDTLGLRRPIPVPGNLRDIALLDGAPWVLDTTAGTVTRVDPSGDLGDPIPVGEAPTDIASGFGYLWITDEGGSVFRVDPDTGSVSEFVVGSALEGVAVDASVPLVWVVVLDTQG